MTDLGENAVFDFRFSSRCDFFGRRFVDRAIQIPVICMIEGARRQRILDGYCAFGRNGGSSSFATRNRDLWTSEFATSLTA